ncbi:hypothetical protein BTVI_01874 [Pitangus sulphuratus]|nr:hypothetical protein BTVI_01874 [Pitangus sulphuratus]
MRGDWEPPGKQELPAELRCEDKDHCESYYQKEGEGPAGVFVPSSVNLDFEGKDLDHSSSDCSRKPRGRVRSGNENTILGDVSAEDLEPVSEEALPYRCKCGSSFQSSCELQEHKQTHLVENSFHCLT